PRQPLPRAARWHDRQDRLGRVGAAARVRMARPPRGRGRAAPCLQPRDRVLRRPPRSRGRARDREGCLIGVLVSGEGTNLQALIDADLPIAGVITSKPGAPALERAEAAGIDTAVFDLKDFETREERDEAMADWLQERDRKSV